MKYRDYLYDHTAFRTFMRSKDATEEEKFQSIERLINQLFLVDNFSDFDKFLKGETITNEDVRIRKGTIPNLRQDSVEWSFVTSFFYKADTNKDVDEKSDEEKKAELLLVVGLSKVYY